MTLSEGGHQAVKRNSFQETMNENEYDETLPVKT